MRVLFLDDDSDILADGLADLDGDRYPVSKCLTIERGMEALTNPDGSVTGDAVVVFVDHDLGAGREGYEFVEWIRRRHPLGHLLPIVYLTGRESERGFLERQAKSPYHTPSLYLSKRDFAKTTFDINEFIADLVRQFSESAEEVEQQRLDETIRFFESIPPRADES